VREGFIECGVSKEVGVGAHLMRRGPKPFKKDLYMGDGDPLK
jgi:hypothetical protein